MLKLILHSTPCSSARSNVANLVSGLKSDQANRAEQSRILSQSIRVEVIDKAKELFEPHSNQCKQLTSDGKRIEKDMKNIIENLEKVAHSLCSLLPLRASPQLNASSIY